MYKICNIAQLFFDGFHQHHPLDSNFGTTPTLAAPLNFDSFYLCVCVRVCVKTGANGAKMSTRSHF